MERLGLRRAAFAALVGGLTLGFLALAWRMLAGGGWTAWEVLILVCLIANAPWLAVSAATGLVGLAVRVLARDPAAAVLPGLRHRRDLEVAPIRTRTLLAVCVRLEDMATVLPPLARLLQDLHAVNPGRFALGILSIHRPEARRMRKRSPSRQCPRAFRLAACCIAGANRTPASRRAT